MIDIILVVTTVILLLIGVAVLLYKLYLNDKNSQELIFFPDHLETLKDKVRVNYNKIDSISLKSFFASKTGWEPRISITYRYESQLKEIILRPHFEQKTSSILQFFDNSYLSNDTLFKLRRYLPQKIDANLNRFLNNEEVLVEDLAPVKHGAGVVLMNPSGTVKLLE
jgi:hypothetical protein